MVLSVDHEMAVRATLAGAVSELNLYIFAFLQFTMQTSAFYFPTLEKADCSVFVLSVSRLVGVTINFLSPNIF